jgi:two-component system cell cycle sensor histidine kinase/response regulator CckA
MNEIDWIEKDFGILDHIPLGMFILRRDLVVLFWNRCLEDWTGIHRNNIVGTNITTHFPHLSNLKYSTRLNDIFEGGPPTIFSSQLHNYIIPSLLSNRKFRIQHTNVTPVQASDGFYALFAIQDVTDLTQRIQDYRTMRDQALEEIKERKRIEEELRRTHEDLELRVKERTADLILLNEQLQEQIAERKQAEEAMRKSEEKYRTIFENTGTATIIIEEDMTISLINTEFAKLSGYSREEIENRKIFEEFIAKDDIDRIKAYHRLRRIDQDIAPMDYEFKFIDKYGYLKDIFAKVQMFPGTKKSLVSLLNITDRKKMENELLQVQKLESIGILAGGIAHDFNNLLTAVLGNISLAKIYVMEREVYTHLIEIEKASLRAKDLTQQLLTFSRGGAPVKKTISIADLIKDSANFALRGSNVKCDFFISPDLWPAEVDEGQIGQVINNLIINAQQAMPNGGTIQMQCDNVTINTESVLPLKAGHYVKISIKDTGIGIPQENIQKIFDPYFTTKPNGSGFGLSTSYSIVKNHNGHISVESRSGTGTTFYIYLPASSKGFSVKKKEDRLITGHGKILLMDDEETVRMVTGKMLRHLGYEVEFAKDGEEAIRLYESAKKSGRPFDAVIMDLTVPGGMGGKEAIIKLNKIEPSVKAIVASGYSHDPVMAEFNKYGFCGVVLKPFTIVELSQALHRIFVSTCE